MQLKAGVRLRSATDDTEVVVVRAPGEAVDLRCGGRPFRTMEEGTAPREAIEAGHDRGALLGKRYSDDELGLELLCTKGGQASISVGQAVLTVKGAKPLPASD